MLRESALAAVLAEESDDSLATDNDSDLEVAAMTLAATDADFKKSADAERFLTKGFATGDDAKMPEEGVYLNRITGTAHKANVLVEGKSCCGLCMNPLCFEFSNEMYALLGCSLCWRSGCFGWVALDVEAAASSSDDDLSAPIEGSATASDIADLGDIEFPGI